MITTKKRKLIYSSLNTKITLLIFLLLFLLVSCDSNDHFVICKASEYDCDYQHTIPGIITVTKGSSRKHYILTEKGMKKTGIREGEPVAYNPETGTAAVKEITDSSIEIFTVDIRNGRQLSPAISFKPNMTSRDGKPFFAVPELRDSCILNDGTLVLLVSYENNYSRTALGSYYFLYVYDKGKTKNPGKYIFREEEIPKNTGIGITDKPFWDEQKNIQCTGKNIYLFSERNYLTGEFFYRNPQTNIVLNRIDISPQGEAEISDITIVAYDNVIYEYYSEKEHAVYTVAQSSEDKTETLRILKLNEEYELPEEPIERTNGEFLFSETDDGKPLVFFVETRKNIEEQRLEILNFN